jgi:hypothetical protein
MNPDTRLLPGGDLVCGGLEDLAHNRLTESALLVLIASPRLRALGLEIPVRQADTPFEHQLYSRLEERLGSGAHSQYNSLIRRIVSFARCLDRERAMTSG